jgi:hypothetical protein
MTPMIDPLDLPYLRGAPAEWEGWRDSPWKMRGLVSCDVRGHLCVACCAIPRTTVVSAVAEHAQDIGHVMVALDGVVVEIRDLRFTLWVGRCPECGTVHVLQHEKVTPAICP